MKIGAVSEVSAVPFPVPTRSTTRFAEPNTKGRGLGVTLGVAL